MYSQWLEMLDFMSCSTQLLEHIAEKQLPVVYGGKIVPNWDDWKEASKKSIVDSREMLLYKYCRSYHGEVVPKSELEHMKELAHEVHPVDPDEPPTESEAYQCLQP